MGSRELVSLALQLSSQELVKQEPAWGGGRGRAGGITAWGRELGRPLEEGPPRRQERALDSITPEPDLKTIVPPPRGFPRPGHPTLKAPTAAPAPAAPLPIPQQTLLPTSTQPPTASLAAVPAPLPSPSPSAFRPLSPRELAGSPAPPPAPPLPSARRLHPSRPGSGLRSAATAPLTLRRGSLRGGAPLPLPGAGAASPAAPGSPCLSPASSPLPIAHSLPSFPLLFSFLPSPALSSPTPASLPSPLLSSPRFPPPPRPRLPSPSSSPAASRFSSLRSPTPQNGPHPLPVRSPSPPLL